MIIRNKITEAMETTTRAMEIQATKFILMEPVITATNLDTSKQIDIRNRVMNKKTIMELVITAKSWYTSKNISARNKVMNKQI